MRRVLVAHRRRPPPSVQTHPAASPNAAAAERQNGGLFGSIARGTLWIGRHGPTRSQRMHTTQPPSPSRFNPTQPPPIVDDPHAVRLSEFQRRAREAAARARLTAPESKLFTTLSPSMLLDLRRFESADATARSGALETLEVLAACLRHGQPLTLQITCGQVVRPLSLFPRHGVHQCDTRPEALWGPGLPAPELLRVEPAFPPTPPKPGAAMPEPQLHPLRALVWAVALYGRRERLLPELAGQACYRLGPGLQLQDVQLNDTQLSVVHTLRRQAATLRELSEIEGLGPRGAARLLNGLYLSGALITSRTHPAARRAGAMALLRRPGG